MKMAEMSMGGSGPTVEPFVESDMTSPRGSTVNDPNGVVGSTGPQVRSALEFQLFYIILLGSLQLARDANQS